MIYMYSLLISDLHIVYMYTMYMFYIYTKDMYIQLLICVCICVCVIFFSWLDWSYRSGDYIFVILITLNISYQECTLSA